MNETTVIQNKYIVRVLLVIYDAIAIVMSFFLALLLRFDFKFSAIPGDYFMVYRRSVLLYAVAGIIIFFGMRLYHSLWKFASFDELLRMIIATVLTLCANYVITYAAFFPMPISYYVVGTLLQFLFTLGIRFSSRLVRYLIRTRTIKEPEHRIMIVGAGNAGRIIYNDIAEAKESQDRVICFVDDDQNTWKRLIGKVTVEGGSNDIPALVEKHDIDTIYCCIPSATKAEKARIYTICTDTGCTVKRLPSMVMNLDAFDQTKLENINVEDLLGRDPIKVDMEEIFAFIENKKILVTGGGGSIGSELCRQIAAHNPKQLVIVDIYENNAYDIQLELKHQYPDLDLQVIIASVRDSRKMFDIFQTYRPELVYHAAAHKHVPLMEDAPNEAIKNNVIGTYKTAFAAMTHGCKRFVLISTDKAVNPTNIMGASKRLCEMIVQSYDHKIKEGKASEIPQLFTHLVKDIHENETEIAEALKTCDTEFVAVRFGNVLGSNGSVIPLFKRQISEGGPVTVTHPDIIRYFMTIPEAVSLVLQAGTYAKGGEIFVLDMGEPVKIDTLARNLIRLAGKKPDEDIKIVYTGLRPGEKLYEEKLMDEEGMQKTKNALIHIGAPIPFDHDEFLGNLGLLMETAYGNSDNIREVVQAMVSTYHPGEH